MSKKLSKKEMAELIPILDKLSKAFAMMGISAKEAADELFKNARALREKAAPLQAAAEYEKFIGSLVARDVVEKIIYERARQFRDGVIVTSRRIASDVVGEESISEIESIVQNELRVMLEQFAKLPVI